jgi:hypothetical protein
MAPLKAWKSALFNAQQFNNSLQHIWSLCANLSNRSGGPFDAACQWIPGILTCCPQKANHLRLKSDAQSKDGYASLPLSAHGSVFTESSRKYRFSLYAIYNGADLIKWRRGTTKSMFGGEPQTWILLKSIFWRGIDNINSVCQMICCNRHTAIDRRLKYTWMNPF